MILLIIDFRSSLWDYSYKCYGLSYPIWMSLIFKSIRSILMGLFYLFDAINQPIVTVNMKYQPSNTLNK